VLLSNFRIILRTLRSWKAPDLLERAELHVEDGGDGDEDTDKDEEVPSRERKRWKKREESGLERGMSGEKMEDSRRLWGTKIRLRLLLLDIGVKRTREGILEWLGRVQEAMANEAEDDAKKRKRDGEAGSGRAKASGRFQKEEGCDEDDGGRLCVA
jgi:hypothetical protein